MALLVAGGCFLSCWLFFAVATVATRGSHLETEQALLRAWRLPDDPARLIGPTWLEEAARDVTGLGSATVLTLLTLLVVAYLFLSRRPRQALLVVIAVGGGTVLSATMKVMFGRVRPSVVPHLTTISDASFPSGHAMLSSVVYLTLGALLAQAAEKRREHLFFINAALALTILVGLSRMALGVHYPSDVLAGWSAGTAWALFCWIGAWWFHRRRGVDPART